MKTLNILIIGELLIDLITKEYTKNIAEAELFEKHFGGSAANIAMNLSDLGFSPIFLSKVGDDPFGKFIVEKLKSRGMDIGNIQIDPINHTSFVLVSKSKETPHFLPLRGADYHLQLPSDIEKFVRSASVLHFSSWPISRKPSRTAVLKILSLAKKWNVKICFDPNYRDILWESGEDGISFIKNIMKDVFLLKPSIDDAKCLLGNMTEEEYIQAFHHLGVKNVVLTLGKDGVLVSDRTKTKKFPSFARHVVDTTGAGDAFWAGMYSSLLRGRDIFESAKIGSAASAFRVESVGSDAPLPPVKNLIKRYL